MFKGRIIVPIVRFFMAFWHPCFRVIGRENVKKDGRMMICANHSGLADPIWIIFALKLGHVPRIMAKREVMQVPVLGAFLRKIGVFGVDRGNADIAAIKTGLRCLNNEEQLLVFPEGTRVKKGKIVEPKKGSVMLAARTNTPILPVYLSTKRRPFGRITCVIGEPYMLEFDGKKPTDDELQTLTEEMMIRIYKLGEGV